MLDWVGEGGETILGHVELEIPIEYRWYRHCHGYSNCAVGSMSPTQETNQDWEWKHRGNQHRVGKWGQELWTTMKSVYTVSGEWVAQKRQGKHISQRRELLWEVRREPE